MKDNFVFLQQFLDQEIYQINKERTLQKVITDETTEEILHEDAQEYNVALTKEIIFIIENEINEEEENLLNNILSSVNLSKDDSNIVNKNLDPEDFENKLQNIQSSKVISFGVTSTKSRLLDIQTKYAPTTVESNTVIIADTLSELESNRELKKMLWNSLKMVFR